VCRAAGQTARRGQFDGFAGAMTRLRSAYDALQQTSPVSAAPDPLIDAMQSGDRISYHPERAPEEIAHFHDVLPKAQAAVAAIDASFAQHLEDWAKRQMRSNQPPSNTEIETRKQTRLDAVARAHYQADQAGK
jgi:alpha-glucosidase